MPPNSSDYLNRTSDVADDLIGPDSPELPDWYEAPPPPPPPPPAPSVAARRSTLERTDPQPSKVQITTVGSGSVLPLCYGKVQIGGKFGYPFVIFSMLYAPVYWCEGNVHSITILRNGDAALGFYNQAFVSTDPVIARNYYGDKRHDGNAQILDTFLEDNIGYTDVHTGVAYSVLKWAYDSAPDDITAIIEGKKIYDPRDDSTSGVAESGWTGYVGSQRPDNPATWKYFINANWVPGQNAALALADFHQKYRGTYESIDWASVAECATHLDTDIGGESVVRRATFSLVIDRRRSYKDYFDTLKEYALVRHHYYDGDTLVLIPDKDSSIVANLTEDDIIQGSLNLQTTDSSDAPDQVIVRYTNTETNVWAEEIAQTPAPTSGTKNLHIVPMSGWQSHQEAYRYAIRRYNRLNLIRLAGSFKAFDESVRYVPGDVITITHQRGQMDAKPFTITDIQAVDLARYEVSIEEYQSNLWSDEIQESGAYTLAEIPLPTDFPVVTFPTVVDQQGYSHTGWEEKLWKDENGRWHTVFEISFNGGDWPHTRGFRYKIFRGGDEQLLDEGSVLYQGDIVHKIVSPPTSQGETWIVQIWVENILGNHDSATYAQLSDLLGNGKQIPPLDIPAGSLTSLEAGQFVALTWGASGDNDLAGYIVKRLEQSLYDADIAAENDPWENINAVTVASRVDSERALFEAQPIGSHYYGVRALDWAGNVSPNPRWILQIVTADGAGSVSVRSLRPNRNLVTSSFNATDTSDDAWNYIGVNDITRLLNQVGLSGLANTATLFKDSEITSHSFRGPKRIVDQTTVRSCCARTFIKLDVTKNYSVDLGLRVNDGATIRETVRVAFNLSTGAFVSSTPPTSATNFLYDIRITTIAEIDWIEVTVSMRPPVDGTYTYDSIICFNRLSDPAATGSWVLGNCELFENMEVPEVAGTYPYVVPDANAAFQNVSFDVVPSLGAVAYVNVGDSWEDRFGTQTSAWPAAQTEAWVHNLSTTGTYYVTSNMWDTGADRFGNWNWLANLIRTYGGASVTYQTDISSEATYPTFTTNSGASLSIDGRFARTRLTLTSSDVDEGFAMVFPATTSYQGKVLKDSVSVSILSQATPTSFSWNVSFAATPRYWYVLNAIPATPVTVALDSVDETGGDAKAWTYEYDSGGPSWAWVDAAADIIVLAEGN